MADVSDVEYSMVMLIAGFLQLGSGYLEGSVATSDSALTACRVFRGWPLAKQLDQDMINGISNVTVFPVPGSTRRDTRYFPKWVPGALITPTLRAEVSGSSIAFRGTVSTNFTVGVAFGSGSARQTYTYRPSNGDTAEAIVAALGAQIDQSTITGPVLTVPSQNGVEAVIAPDQLMWTETRRQEQNIWVIGWCQTPAARDSVMSTIDEGFANLLDPYGNLTDQFPLPDGSSARLLYISSHTDDQHETAGVWRRDLRYVACYPTILSQTFPTMVFGPSTSTSNP